MVDERWWMEISALNPCLGKTFSSRLHVLQACGRHHRRLISLQSTSQARNIQMATTLVKSLSSEAHTFLQPPTTLHNSSLDFLKQTLDPIAKSIADTQQQRLQEARKKRKRGQDHVNSDDILRAKKIHVDGFGVEQVWEQARRIIDAARKEAQRNFDELAEKYAIDDESEDDGEDADGEEQLSAEGESDIGEEGVDYEVEGEDADGEEQDEDENNNAEEEMVVDGSDMSMMDSEAESEQAAEYVPDPHGLNDGFFSIDDFNKQSEFLEQADARGDNDFDNEDDDDEGIDWGSNPLGAGASTTTADKTNNRRDDSDDEDGPTFGNVDLNAPEGFSDNEEEVDEGDMDGLGSLSNTNQVKYAEFFAPPAKKARPNKRGRPNPHNFPAKVTTAPINPSGEEDDEEEIERTVEKVHRDLFDDVSDEEEEEEDASKLDPADPRSRRSAHERRQAALTEEIRRLEAANVAKREWTLSGEARAADRPVNSLLEQDLEFERVGKPIPVITAEISESLEDLIKRRILAEDFQDIIRRRPDDLATGNSTRRGRLDFELDDTKSKKSLAEQYEEEHLKATDPNYVDAKDEKTQKEQREIDALWRDISSKLDGLSSWHFKPKGPATQLDIRVDAPVVRLEDARPTAGAEAAAASQLAPQEIYKVGEAADKSEAEIATRGGLVINREEMSREERKRRRSRNKEREKKSLSNVDPLNKESNKTTERKGIISHLKKGGVKVIGNKGQITDVAGAAVDDSKAPSAGASYKL
jgi:U3 small nucleolar RNA-associated protein MPP10